jgi:hypothetical protein
MHAAKNAGTVRNPWVDLPDAPLYVLPEDAEPLARFNDAVEKEYKYHLESLPEPFLGRPGAPIVLLSLNPGFDGIDEQSQECDNYFRAATLANLSHSAQEYPFYFLDPTKNSSGHVWWQRRLRELTDLFGHRVVAENVLCLEYFPYASKYFHAATPRIASQTYTFALLRKALQRKAQIIVTRSKTLWLDAVPELATGNTHFLNSNQAAYITRNNCPTGFAEACERLRTAGSRPPDGAPESRSM